MHLQPSRRLFNHAHCNERKALQANYCGATAYRLPQDIFHEQNWKNHCPVNQHRAQFLDKSRSCASSTLLCNLGNTTHTHFIPRTIYLWSWRRKKSTEKYVRRFLWCQMLIRKNKTPNQTGKHLLYEIFRMLWLDSQCKADCWVAHLLNHRKI